VGAGAATTHRRQRVRRGKPLFGELGARTDTGHVGIPDLGNQLVANQRAFQQLDIGVAVLAQVVDCRIMNTFEQQDTDLVFLKGRPRPGTSPRSLPPSRPPSPPHPRPPLPPRTPPPP